MKDSTGKEPNQFPEEAGVPAGVERAQEVGPPETRGTGSFRAEEQLGQ